MAGAQETTARPRQRSGAASRCIAPPSGVRRRLRSPYPPGRRPRRRRNTLRNSSRLSSRPVAGCPVPARERGHPGPAMVGCRARAASASRCPGHPAGPGIQGLVRGRLWCLRWRRGLLHGPVRPTSAGPAGRRPGCPAAGLPAWCPDSGSAPAHGCPDPSRPADELRRCRPVARRTAPLGPPRRGGRRRHRRAPLRPPPPASRPAAPAAAPGRAAPAPARSPCAAAARQQAGEARRQHAPARRRPHAAQQRLRARRRRSRSSPRRRGRRPDRPRVPRLGRSSVRLRAARGRGPPRSRPSRCRR